MQSTFSTVLTILSISTVLAGCVMTTKKFESKGPREAVDATYSYVAGLIVHKCPSNYRIKPSLAGEQRRYNNFILSLKRQEMAKPHAQRELANSMDDLRNGVFDTQCRNMGSFIAQAYGTSRYLEAVN
ncbi:hypothetical protein [Phyllobacterium sp. YR531]|uniref:hypothetical protein n=1 Tax=Phyllobacterium sp. YR531 TaxID=1144343 RepID=UPI00026FBB15|nr:hypothetical protein [Phyllobacterium sp. YR531]EJN03536.1 hypothetical protein PMI41_02531 [Phyllobacterium sp. YR531]